MDGVQFTPPPGWQTAVVAPPTLGPGSEVTVDRWEAWREAEGGPGRAVAACLGVDLGAWTDEATPVALERVLATTRTVAAGLDPGVELRVLGEDRSAIGASQRLARVGDGAERVVARTVLGFTRPGPRPHLAGCFVVCAPTSAACEDALGTLDTSGFVPPPPPGALLRGVALGIHHPRAVAMSAAALFFLLGAVAIWTRPRPRRK